MQDGVGEFRTPIQKVQSLAELPPSLASES
jgi:hypothetical protein